MSWGFLTRLLDEIYYHSTFVGKLWLTVLIIFRIVLTVVGGESIYDDEQSGFVCNTLQPGCENVCYNAFAPLSHQRFWVFQIIIVATPSVLYLGYALNRIAVAEERAEKAKKQGAADVPEDGDEEVGLDINGKAELEGGDATKADAKVCRGVRQRIKKDGLMRIYVTQLLVRSILEVGFLIMQFCLYGLAVHANYVCESSPCPYKVDCFVSRPTEKTIFLLLMYAVSFLSLALNIWEMTYLGVCTIYESGKARGAKRKDRNKSRSSAPPECNVVVKPLVMTPRGRPLPVSKLTKGLACQQNAVNAAREECLRYANDNIKASAPRGTHKKTSSHQSRKEQQSLGNKKPKAARDPGEHKHAKRSSSKANQGGSGSPSRGSEDGKGKDAGWI